MRAHLLLTHGVIAHNDDIRAELDRALYEAGNDAALRGSVLARMAENEAAIRVARIPVAETWAREAMQGASTAAEQLVALGYLAWTQALGGWAVDDLCEQHRALSPRASYLVESPDRVAGQRLVWRGELRRARELLTLCWPRPTNVASRGPTRSNDCTLRA